MIKINIKFNDEAFAYDLGEQIKRYITDAEVEYTNPDEKTDYFFTDNDDIETKENATKYKELPIVLFSKVQDFSDTADMVIQMPFSSINFSKISKTTNCYQKYAEKNV